MARVAKSAPERQDEILDVAQRLFMTRGYDDTPIQALIDEVGIAKGTFYHHFPSKPALLDALVRRIVDQSVAIVRPIVDDPGLDAITKFNESYARVGAWKAERKELLIEIHRVTYAESNVALTGRLQRDSIAAFVPLFGAVVEQGVREGVFDTPYPYHAARGVMDLSVPMSRFIGDALIEHKGGPELFDVIELELRAWQHAVDRLLGARPGALKLVDLSVLKRWFEPDPPRRSP